MVRFRISVFCARAARVALLIGLSAAVASPAFANAQGGPEIRSVTSDADGNAILRTRGGAKIIVVGEGERLKQVFATPVVIEADGDCRTDGIVVRGRSFMYGVSSGDPTPVIAKRVCD